MALTGNLFMIIVGAALALSDAGNIPEAMQYFREFLKTAPPEHPAEFIDYAKNKIEDLSEKIN